MKYKDATCNKVTETLHSVYTFHLQVLFLKVC